MSLTIAITVRQLPSRAALVAQTASAIRELIGDPGPSVLNLMEMVGGQRVQPGLVTIVEGAVYVMIFKVEEFTAEVELSTFWRDSLPGLVSTDKAGQVVHINVSSVRTAADIALGAAVAVAVAREGEGRIDDLSGAFAKRESIAPEEFLRVARTDRKGSLVDRLEDLVLRLPVP